MISLSRICLKLARFLVKIAIFGGGGNLFYCFNNGTKKKKSVVILPEEFGYIARRVRLYCRKSAVILPEECGYIAKRVRLYCGRVRLYFCKDNSGHLRLHRWRTHSARTNFSVTGVCLNQMIFSHEPPIYKLYWNVSKHWYNNHNRKSPGGSTRQSFLCEIFYFS